MFDATFHGMFDGMFGGMFDASFDGTFDGTFDAPFDGMFGGIFDRGMPVPSHQLRLEQLRVLDGPSPAHARRAYMGTYPCLH